MTARSRAERVLALSAVGVRARRPAPGEPLRFITVRFSHFCEKARWALDRGRVAYREESHVPMFSWRATYGAGAGRTVPALVTPDQVLGDSTDILRWVDAHGAAAPLFPTDPGGAEVTALEAELDERFGPATRRLVYFHLLPDERAARAVLASAGGRRRCGRGRCSRSCAA